MLYSHFQTMQHDGKSPKTLYNTIKTLTAKYSTDSKWTITFTLLDSIIKTMKTFQDTKQELNMKIHKWNWNTNTKYNMYPPSPKPQYMRTRALGPAIQGLTDCHCHTLIYRKLRTTNGRCPASALLASSSNASLYCSGQSCGSFLWIRATYRRAFILEVSKRALGPHTKSYCTGSLSGTRKLSM